MRRVSPRVHIPALRRELRPEWWLPRAGSGPGQVAEGLQVVSYGLLLPNQRARAGHRITLGTHVAPSGSGTKTLGLLFFELIGQYRIILVSWPGVNVVKWAVERTTEKQETVLPQIL